MPSALLGRPRELLHRRYWLRIQERHNRLRVGTLESRFISPPPDLLDYWPEVPATIPEKTLFLALAQAEINFYFSYYVGDFPFSELEEESYRPDFILPDYRVIIEVQGVYWHTRPGMWEHDFVKWQFYTMAGYKMYFITDTDILQDVGAVLESIPEVHSGAVHGNFIGIGDRPFIPNAAILSRMQKYPKVTRTHFAGTRRFNVLRTFRPPSQLVDKAFESESLFDPAMIGEEFVNQLRSEGAAWLDYMGDLRNLFQDPNAILAYPDQYAYLKKWDTWWNRYSTIYAPEVNA